MDTTRIYYPLLGQSGLTSIPSTSMGLCLPRDWSRPCLGVSQGSDTARRANERHTTAYARSQKRGSRSAVRRLSDWSSRKIFVHNAAFPAIADIRVYHRISHTYLLHISQAERTDGTVPFDDLSLVAHRLIASNEADEQGPRTHAQRQ